jgi:ribonuclease P protein component
MKKEYRLKRNEDFQTVIKKNNNLANSSFAAYYSINDLGKTRVGISVSSKLGIAVIRNKIKRQIRMMTKEAIDFSNSIDIIFIVRKGYLSKNYADNLYEMKKLVEKIMNALKKEV